MVMDDFLFVILFIVGVVVYGYKLYRKALSDVEAAPTVAPEQGMPSDAIDNDASEYFTYETVDANNTEVSDVCEAAETSASARVVEAPSADSQSSVFDLRQAIIYQTILQNDYISDLK